MKDSFKKAGFGGAVRGILGWLWALVFFFVLTIILIPVFYLIKLFSPKAARSYANHIIKKSLRFETFLIGTKINIIGRENLTGEPVLYVSNHRSYFDVIVFFPCIIENLGFVAKKEFKKVLPLAIWIHAAGSYFLDRKNPRKALTVINNSAENIKNGTSMCIYPEGTRSQVDGCIAFKEGAFKIAEKAGCKVVPVTLIGTNDLYETGCLPFANVTDVYAVFGKPVDFAGLTKQEHREACKKVEEEINATYRKYADIKYKK